VFRVDDVPVSTQITDIDRVREVPNAGKFADLLWSDPHEIDTWAINPRGVGYLFGSKVAAEVCLRAGACATSLCGTGPVC